MKKLLTGAMVLSAVIGMTFCTKPAQTETQEPQKQEPQEQKDTTAQDPDPEPDPEPTGRVLIVGGGASGFAAGVQAARLGVETCIVEETEWIGGMLTSAGVTATDGCHYLRGGLFAEFINGLADVYGGVSKLKTGWVSNVLFEPSVGEQVLEDICSKEQNLTIIRGKRFQSCEKTADGWRVYFEDGSQYDCNVLLDCTELGDVAKAAGVKYHIGMDAPSYGNESCAIGPNDVIQDITMVMTLKNYGRDVTIDEPANYDESRYYNCCKNSLNVPYDTGQTLWDPSKMMSYGKTPKGEYMINWPIFGNDWYVNMIEMDYAQRDSAIRRAKEHSLGYLYFMQTKLGFNTYGLAENEYPTQDNFPMYPYHRESRRIEGEYLFTVNDAVDPFSVPQPAYRCGVAVGDYPVDHHHFQYPDWKSVKITFPSIKSFTVPLGCIVPLGVEDLLVCEKSISVTNVINGSTRLQPVVMELGQAAGALAAMSIISATPVRNVSVRRVQSALINAGALLQPFRDCLPSTKGFEAVQRVASTGILRGSYTTQGWSNIANFGMTDKLKYSDLYLSDYYTTTCESSSRNVSFLDFKALVKSILQERGMDESAADAIPSISTNISRVDAAIYLDQILDPFSREVDWNGNLKEE